MLYGMTNYITLTFNITFFFVTICSLRWPTILVYELVVESTIRGYHHYKTIWTAITGQVLQVKGIIMIHMQFALKIMIALLDTFQRIILGYSGHF